jgi:hypothetical protein
MTIPTQIEKLQKLLDSCKCGVHLSVNEHRNYYQTAEESLSEKYGYECPPEIEDEVRKVMVDTDTIIDLQFYSRTPVGSYHIYHHDLDAALDEALDTFAE